MKLFSMNQLFFSSIKFLLARLVKAYHFSFCIFLLLLFVNFNAFAQAPDGQAPSAFIRPHHFGSAASLNALAPQAGSIAYRYDIDQMFYRNNSAWVQFGGGGSSSGWNLTGNAIGGSTSNFVGTTDNSELHIRANNIKKLLIMPGPTGRHRALFEKTVYLPNYGLHNSSVLGMNGTNGRLRITAGSDDTSDNTQGASIDLHGNTAGDMFARGRLDLVAGSSASTQAITFWGNAGLEAVLTSSAALGIGTATPMTPGGGLHVNGGAAKPTGNLWSNISDRRLKQNITPYTKGKEEIIKIKPVNYQYNEQSKVSDLDRLYVGVIAQEMEEVLPSTIVVINDSLSSGIEDLRMFDSSELLYTLINAIKELAQENRELNEEHAANRLMIQKLMNSIKK